MKKLLPGAFVAFAALCLSGIALADNTAGGSALDDLFGDVSECKENRLWRIEDTK